MSPDSSEQANARHRVVFVSHSSRDTWVSRQLASQIEAAGARVFLDASDLQAGVRYSEVIRAALLDADELVVLWTPWAVERLYIAMEVGAAWVRGIPIIQVLYGLTATELSQSSNFPDPLQQLQMLRLDDFERYIADLKHRIRGEADL